jgi:RNA polymerase sigma-54 factor
MYNDSNLSQQLNLAPQLLNWLKILQASSLELTQMVHNELTSNPALEVSEPEDIGAQDDYTSDELPAVSDEAHFDESDFGERLSVLADIDEEWRTADAPSLTSNDVLQEKHDYMMDHLAKSSDLQDAIEEGLRFSNLTEVESNIAQVITGSIDERGYLDAEIEDIALQTGDDHDVIEATLKKFQQLVPAGIGARDMRECLLLQLQALDGDTELAELLVSDWLENLAMKQDKALADHLGVDYDDLLEALDIIRTLNPEPGRTFQSRAVEYIDADLEIYSQNGELKVELLDQQLPRLQLSSYCKRLLDARNGSKEDLDFIRKKIREASFLIQGISQRQETMLKVTREIMRVQREYLTSDDGQLQPLTMNKVASMIGVHETTVSRAIANKYIRTERGLVEMRKFFKAGYRCADGSSVTPEKVKKQISVFITAEEELKPLTDAHISDLFKKQGLKVARRTIAKYREELNIPSSKARLAAAKRRQLPVAV